MAFLVFAILFGLTGAICLIMAILKPDMDYRRNVFIVGVVGVVLALVTLVSGSIMTVPVGNVAVMSRFGKITGEVKTSGLSLKVMVDTPINLSIRTQKQETMNAAASMDLQDVKTTIATNYRIDPAKAADIYRTLGMDYWIIFAAPTEQEVVKSITATYNAADDFEEEVKAKITEVLTARLAERGIIAETINITNFEFSSEFTAAIESKVVAAQQVMQAHNQLERIKVEALQAQAKAEGDASAAIARANGQAEANKIIAESLTPEVLQYFMFDKLGQDVKIMVIPSGQQFALTIPTP